jgi:5-methylcytosine-specific restriction endonuclease McrA
MYNNLRARSTDRKFSSLTKLPLIFFSVTFSEVNMKTCSYCGLNKPFEEFYKNGSNFRGECKDCIKDKRKNFYNQNSDSIKKRVMDYYFRNHEENKKKLNKRYHADIEKSRMSLRDSYEKNKESRRLGAKVYRQKNPIQYKATRSVCKHRRRNADGSFSSSDLLNMLDQQKGKCVYCQIDISSNFHVDHIVPISKGGTNHLFNIQLLCPTCNMKKHTTDHETFLKRQRLKLWQ